MREFKIILLTILVIGVLAPIINNVLLEKLLFPGNQFSFLSFAFGVVESFILCAVVRFMALLQGIKMLPRIFTGKEITENDAKKMMKAAVFLVFPAAVFYGLLAGIVFWVTTEGFSLFNSIGKAIVLSFAWAMIFRYCWFKGYIFWLIEGEGDINTDQLFDDHNPEVKEKSIGNIEVRYKKHS